MEKEQKERTVGSILKGILDERGIRVRKLAEETGINEQTLYSLIRRNSTKMDIESLLAICKYLHVTPEIFDPEGGGAGKPAAAKRSRSKAELARERDLAALIREALDTGFTAREVRLALEFIKKVKAKGN